MATASLECKSCGCHLDHGDVRQLALYYRQEHPSMVAVQYVCPRCGTTEWQQYDPTEWRGEAMGLAADWAALAQDLGLHSAELPRQPDAPPVETVVEPERLTPAEATFEPEPEAAFEHLAGPITMDEYIEFACRISHLAADDLGQLHGG